MNNFDMTRKQIEKDLQDMKRQERIDELLQQLTKVNDHNELIDVALRLQKEVEGEN